MSEVEEKMSENNNFTLKIGNSDCNIIKYNFGKITGWLLINMRCSDPSSE